MTKFIWLIFCFVSLFHASHQATIDYNGPTIGEQLGELLQSIGQYIPKLFLQTQNDEFVNYAEESYFYKLLSKLNSVFDDTTESVIKSSNSEEDTVEVIEILGSTESDELGFISEDTMVDDVIVSPNTEEEVEIENFSISSDSSSEEDIEVITPKGKVVLRKTVPVPYVQYPIPSPEFSLFNPDFQYINDIPDIYSNYEVISD